MLKEDCRQGNDMAEVNEIWQSEQLLLSIAKMQMQYEKNPQSSLKTKDGD
jgi:hypothetical protein